jgi:hypothetical protein
MVQKCKRNSNQNLKETKNTANQSKFLISISKLSVETLSWYIFIQPTKKGNKFVFYIPIFFGNLAQYNVVMKILIVRNIFLFINLKRTVQKHVVK